VQRADVQRANVLTCYALWAHVLRESTP
jgi:hypothetical protein